MLSLSTRQNGGGKKMRSDLITCFGPAIPRIAKYKHYMNNSRFTDNVQVHTDIFSPVHQVGISLVLLGSTKIFVFLIIHQYRWKYLPMNFHLKRTDLRSFLIVSKSSKKFNLNVAQKFDAIKNESTVKSLLKKFLGLAIDFVKWRWFTSIFLDCALIGRPCSKHIPNWKK